MYPQDPTAPGQYPQAPGAVPPPTASGHPGTYPGAYPWAYPGTYPGAPLPPAPKSKRWIPAVALTAAAALAGSGYAIYQDRHASSAACSAGSADTVKLDRKGESEPTISIPVTAGWKTVGRDATGPSAALDSPYIRGMVINTGIKEQDFNPNIVVTLEKSNATSSQEANDQALTTARRTVGAITGQSSHTVCGNTVYQSDFSGVPGPDGKTQTGSWFITTVEAADGGLWLATATLQTRNPENPDYIAERDALQDGFRMEAVGGG